MRIGGLIMKKKIIISSTLNCLTLIILLFLLYYRSEIKFNIFPFLVVIIIGNILVSLIRIYYHKKKQQN